MSPIRVEPSILLPRALEHQEKILRNKSKSKVVVIGRRGGKTVMGLIACILGHGPKNRAGVPKYPGAIHGAAIWWVAPTYKIGKIIWRSLKHSLRGAWVSKNEVDWRIDLPGGGSVTVRSADDPDALRGAGINGVVVDEAALLSEEAWGEALQPTLLDNDGWAILISTPKGINWFKRMFDAVPSKPDWARWQMPTWVNPRISKSRLEEARRDMGPLEFAQEIEALFVTAGAGMFKPEWRRYWRPVGSLYQPELGLDGLETLALQDVEDTPRSPRTVSVRALRRFATVDLAASKKTTADFTVIATWGVWPDRHDLILLDVVRERLGGDEFPDELWRAYQLWKPSFIGMESSGMQLAIVQQATAKGLPTKELRPMADKIARATTAQARMSQGRIWFPADAEWLHEIETEVLAFPEGEHDDFVDTMAYAAIELTSHDLEPAIAPLGSTRESPWRIQ